MKRRLDDTGVSAVIGAIVVLAVVGIALLYVNAFHVPRQGAALEVGAAERTEGALLSLASDLARSPEGPSSHAIPLRVERATPPLLSGVVLTPARADGTLGLDASSSRITISVVVPAPASGVPAGDSTRAPVAGGLMRVHLLGSATAGQPLGALRATTGGAYLDPAQQVLEGGAVAADTDVGSASTLAPALRVNGDILTWRLPLLVGDTTATTSGATAHVALTPGPEAALGGGTKASEVRIKIETARLAAWRAALNETVGTRGVMTATATGPDTGTVEAVLTNAELRLFVVRYQVSLSG